MPGTDLEQVNPARDLVNWVRSEDTRAQIALALPEDVSIDRFERATVTALLAKPELAGADKASLYLALLNAAQAGLVPDGKQGTINVYNTKVKDADGQDRWVEKAQFLPMIGGIRLTLAKYGWVLRTEVICENDVFEDYTSEGHVVHRKPRPGVDRGSIQGAFAMAVHRDGRREAVTMDKAAIDKVRDKSSRSKKVWDDWYDRMAEKTAGHRLAKKLGLDPQDLIRIADPADVEPADAEAALYGPNGETFHAIEAPAEPSTRAAAGEAHGGEAGTQQAAASPSPHPGEAAAPGPDDDDPEPQPAAAVPEAVDLELTAGTVVPSGAFAGQTLAQVAETADGREWLAWALRNRGRFDPGFYDAVAAYVEARLAAERQAA